MAEQSFAVNELVAGLCNKHGASYDLANHLMVLANNVDSLVYQVRLLMQSMPPNIRMDMKSKIDATEHMIEQVTQCP